MPRKRAESVDVAIVGAGVAGIMLSKKLSELGAKVALIEKGQTLASGPSTRNEGILHAGTYHSISVENREEAIRVARRCKYGHDQIRRYAPEAIEDIDIPTFAIIKDQTRVTESKSRWDEAGVGYTDSSMSEFRKYAPQSTIDKDDQGNDIPVTVFKVDDVSINTPMLYQKLVNDARRAGTTIYTNADTKVTGDNELEVKTGRRKRQIQARVVVHSSGAGMKQFFQENYGVDLPMRFWKSHLILTPKLADANIYVLDPNEADVMVHGGYNIVGVKNSVLVDSPNYDIIPEEAAMAQTALRRLFRQNKPEGTETVACIKVDMPQREGSARSLDVTIGEPLKNVFTVIPGKMTEAPYVTDLATQIIYQRLQSAGDIAKRPVDVFANRRQNYSNGARAK